jgi:hypothetical protein
VRAELRSIPNERQITLVHVMIPRAGLQASEGGKCCNAGRKPPAADQAVCTAWTVLLAERWIVLCSSLNLVSNLLCSPARVLLFELQDQVLDLKGQTISVPIRPAASIGQSVSAIASYRVLV